MEVKDFLHMNEGDGELSYSLNSFVQKGVSLMSQPILESAIQTLISEEEGPIKALNVADLGCGVGPVPLAFVPLVIRNVEKKCKELNWEEQVPEIQIYLNDLPSNDFNLLFRKLWSLELPKRKDGKSMCFLMGAPGSYHGRLFPKNILHFAHSNYTLHWLSQAPRGLYSKEGVPINKGNIYISETSPTGVAKAYLAQFEKDLTQFLKCRSEEVLPKGCMVLTFRGRPSTSILQTWQPWELNIFAQAITCLVSQGLIKEEKIDSFDFPYFGACKEEIEGIVESEGSFAIENTKTIVHHVAHEIEDKRERAENIGKFMRAFTESLISSHFGEEVVDPLYEKLTLLTFQHLANDQPTEHFTIIIVLRRK